MTEPSARSTWRPEFDKSDLTASTCRTASAPHAVQCLQIQLPAVLVATNFIVGRCTASAIASASLKSFFSIPCYKGGHIWPASTWHRDRAMRVCGSGGVRRRRLPYRSGKTVYWRAALPLGHATTFAAARWRHAHRGPRRGTSSCRYRCLGDRGIGCLRHGVLLVFGAPCQLRLLAGQEHGRTIPLTDMREFRPSASHSSFLSGRSISSYMGTWVLRPQF